MKKTLERPSHRHLKLIAPFCFQYIVFLKTVLYLTAQL
ncbi:hypothetical protein KGM_213681 [Danaus plexippus plexippus]|uniref:Uncharacterized protein n=1 Tax=Danaus plexippus plexippus TaxID=278856 RepID=A0A212EK26_DANPL|nr:hypothetical protein KGM_213681 [Danaus plexippus plexippus]